MAIPCFVIVAAIAASSPAGPVKGADAARRVPAPTMTMTMTTTTPRTTMARALPEPPPMARGRRSAHGSIRRLVAAE